MHGLVNCPNIVTAVRTLAATSIFVVAAGIHSPTVNFVGLVVYWLLDILDGRLARMLDRETRFGAVFDILSDRLLVALFYVNYTAFHPETMTAVLLFLFCFMGLDLYLSLQFLRWPLRSPNYFGEVDPVIWALNWSAPAKAANTGLVTLILVATGSVSGAAAVCLVVIAIKVYSTGRLLTLRPLPLEAGERGA